MKARNLALPLLAAILLVPSVAEAQRRPPPQQNANAGRILTKGERQAHKVQLKQNLAVAKARVKQGKPIVKQQQQLLKQTTRNEMQLRGPAVAARARVDAAKQAWRANPSPQTVANWRSAYADYKPKRDAHESALGLKRQAQSTLVRYRQQQQAAIATLSQAQQQARRGPPRVARPVYAQHAALRAAPSVGGYGVYGPSPLAAIYGPAHSGIRRTNNYDDVASVRSPPAPYTLASAGGAGGYVALPGWLALPNAPRALRQNAYEQVADQFVR